MIYKTIDTAFLRILNHHTVVVLILTLDHRALSLKVLWLWIYSTWHRHTHGGKSDPHLDRILFFTTNSYYILNIREYSLIHRIIYTYSINIYFLYRQHLDYWSNDSNIIFDYIVFTVLLVSINFGWNTVLSINNHYRNCLDPPIFTRSFISKLYFIVSDITNAY